MICSNIHDISYAIAFGIIFQLVFQNQSLADQPCTTEGLYPLEVLYEVLSVDKHSYKNRPTNHVQIRNIFYSLWRLSPSRLSLVLK